MTPKDPEGWRGFDPYGPKIHGAQPGRDCQCPKCEAQREEEEANRE